jgi:predicted nucleic acid-binding protein
MATSLVCADASLALKLLFPERDSTTAQALWDAWRTANLTVIAPSLWGYEVTSVLRNRVHRGLFPADKEAAALDVLHLLPVRLLRPDGLHRRAWEIAHRFKRSAAYDAHYLALAEIAGCPFWTADERLFNAVKDQLGWVRWLGDYLASSTA